MTCTTKLGIKNLVNKWPFKTQGTLKAETIELVHAQAALAKQGKISDVMIGTFWIQPQRIETITVVGRL